MLQIQERLKTLACSGKQAVYFTETKGAMISSNRTPAITHGVQATALNLGVWGRYAELIMLKTSLEHCRGLNQQSEGDKNTMIGNPRGTEYRVRQIRKQGQ